MSPGCRHQSSRALGLWSPESKQTLRSASRLAAPRATLLLLLCPIHAPRALSSAHSSRPSEARLGLPLSGTGEFPIRQSPLHCSERGTSLVKLTTQHVCTGHPHPQKHAGCNQSEPCLKVQDHRPGRHPGQSLHGSHLVLLLQTRILGDFRGNAMCVSKAGHFSRGRDAPPHSHHETPGRRQVFSKTKVKA